MFKWLLGRRPPTVARSRETQRPVPARRAAAPMGAAALAGTPADSVLPEVVAEGNTQADWSAWEDSMIAWDSQMQDLVPSHRVYVRDTGQSRLDEVDPFAGVASKRAR